MNKAEQIEREIECVNTIIKTNNDIQEKLVWCGIETGTYIFALNLMDLVYKMFDSIRDKKYKELKRIQEQNNFKFKK